MEWSDRNRYNSFSSFKGLAYFDHYKKIVGWLEGKNELPSPIECNLDPIAECNLDCYFCITQRYLKRNRYEAGQMRELPIQYMLKLVDFLADWGVKGLCLSGGGEPTLLPSKTIYGGIADVIWQAKRRNMDVALFTNAVKMSEYMASYLVQCRWITLSVDAADKESYLKIKGRNKFDTVLRNIEKLVNMRRVEHSDVSLTWCSLVLPENQYSLHKMCKLAKETGVQVFRVRPVDFERPDIEGHKPLAIDVPRVMEEFAKCHEEETPDFQVYTTVEAKFDANFHVKHEFSSCLATPLLLPILSNGQAYLCVDKKMQEEFRLGSCYPDPEQILSWWGGEGHRQLIKSVNINNCSRCTFGPYNRQIEEVVLKDGMCLSFP